MAKVDGRQGVKVGKLRFVSVVSFVALAGCAVDRFDAASCRCVGEHPWPRSTLEELQLRQCVLANRGDGPRELDETQCRLWLTSPWLKEPPTDDVAGRVLALPEPPRWYWLRSVMPVYGPFDPRVPWLQDDPCTSRQEPDGEDPEVAKREASLAAACADMAETACRHRFLSEAVQLLRPLAEGEWPAPAVLGLPLFCVVRADGSLDLASIGHHWWRLPPAKPHRVADGLAGEVPRVDVAALATEIRWMRQLYPQVAVELAAQDGASWGDLWAVWWAIDEIVTTDRTDRHWSRVREPLAAGSPSGTDADAGIYVDTVQVPTCPEWHARHRIVLSDPNSLQVIWWEP